MPNYTHTWSALDFKHMPEKFPPSIETATGSSRSPDQRDSALTLEQKTGKNAEPKQDSVHAANKAASEKEDELAILAIKEKMGLESAFSDALLPTNFDARNIHLWKLKDDPSKLVREQTVGEGQTVAELEGSIREGEALFAQMRDEYGIQVVSMDSRREKNKSGEEAMFTLVDNIDGQNLFEIKSLPLEAKDELETLYLSLGQYYHDMWKQKGKYWGDARSDQFVYGSKAGEKQSHFYLTDVDPEFYREGDDKWHTMEAVLGSVSHDLVENEGKFGDKVRFQQARKKLLDIIEKMLKENPNQNMLVEAKGWLEA